MQMTKEAIFTAGRNIAMKVLPHQYEATVQFYRDVLNLKEITKDAPSVGFEFGSNNLWIDLVPGVSQAEIWLEVVTNDLAAALEHLKAAGVVRCDELEPLMQGVRPPITAALTPREDGLTSNLDGVAT